MNIPVIWLSYYERIDARGPWDTHILERLFSGESWSHGIEFIHMVVTPEHPNIPNLGDVAIVVLPARHHCAEVDVTRLNRDLSMFKGVILILCGDEEAQFPWRDIEHPNIRFWVQMPDPEHYADMASFAFFFGNGFADMGEVPDVDKNPAWIFAGQGTHKRRKAAIDGLKQLERRLSGILLATEGFAQGMSRPDYLDALARAWVAPAPSGPRHVDTFRAYEALELGCIPIVDGATPAGPSNYWEFVYGTVPFPVVTDWGTVGGIIEDCYRERYLLSARCGAWWSQQKAVMAHRLRQDLHALGAHVEFPQVSAIITTSPVPSNPSLSAIKETVYSIREVFGSIGIQIAADGVRPEQEHLRTNYETYLYKLARWVNSEPSIALHVSPHWLHQALLTRAALDSFVHDAPLMLFCEHDTPLVTDVPIDVESAIRVLSYGFIDVLRFHHEALVHPEHEHLMIDRETTLLDGLPVRRTTQWSQRPHLARTRYYRGILDRFFPPGCRTMIEDKMHSVVQSAPYGEHRIAIYHPGHDNIKRSYHLDSRGDEQKYPMKFK